MHCQSSGWVCMTFPKFKYERRRAMKSGEQRGTKCTIRPDTCQIFQLMSYRCPFPWTAGPLVWQISGHVGGTWNMTYNITFIQQFIIANCQLLSPFIAALIRTITAVPLKGELCLVFIANSYTKIVGLKFGM